MIATSSPKRRSNRAAVCGVSPISGTSTITERPRSSARAAARRYTSVLPLPVTPWRSRLAPGWSKAASIRSTAAAWAAVSCGDVAAGADRVDLGAALDPRLLDRDEAARLEPAHGGVPDQRGRERAAGEPLERLALLRAEPLAAVERVTAGGGQRRAQGSPRARALARAGSRPRRQHERQPARGRRDVLLGGPQPEPDELGRHAALERLDRLDELLRRHLAALGGVDDDAEHAPAAERDHEHAAHAGLHPVRHPVVERAPEGPRLGERLDLRDHAAEATAVMRSTGQMASASLVQLVVGLLDRFLVGLAVARRRGGLVGRVLGASDVLVFSLF